MEAAADVLDNLQDFNGLGKLDRRSITPFQEVVDAADPPADLRAAVLALLPPEGTQVDDLVRRCQFSSSAVLAVLLELELAGRVRTLPGNRVALLSDAA